MLNNARHMSNPHLAERVCAMASIIENESLFRIDRVHKIRAKTDGKPNDAYEVSRRRGTHNVCRFQRHGTQEPKIIGRRHEDITISAHSGPLHGWMRMIVRQTGAKDLLLRRRGAQFSFKLTHERQVDMFLINDHPIQLDNGDFSWDGVETPLDHGIFQKFD